MNNHDYHGNDEPAECPICFSSLTETTSITSTWLQCDKCEYQTREDNDNE